MSQIQQHLQSMFGLAPGDANLRLLQARSVFMNVPEGARLFASGDVCENFVIVASGRARVQISTRTGRDIILFRLMPGQSCALTTSCLLSDSPYFAEGIAETDMELITIPSADFHEVMIASPHTMRTLLDDFAARIGTLTALVDRLTSRDLDTELASLLLMSADEAGVVPLSHQAIADEIGTAREVVSRKLKELEKSGILTLGRGALTLIDRSRLNSAQQSRQAR